MATIKDAAWAADDEHDEEYAASLKELHDASSSEGEQDEEGRSPKRLKLDSDDVSKAPSVDVDEVFASMQGGTGTSKPATSRKKVKIIKRFKFAGEEHDEEIEVWDDSQEALDYAESIAKPTEAANAAFTVQKSDAPIDRDTATFGQGYERRQAAADGVAQVKPGPKRPKASLAGLAASIGKGGKALKLSTLEKSKMDWNKFVTQHDMADDLARGRQDGFTERQAFLERSGDRAEVFERHKHSK